MISRHLVALALFGLLAPVWGAEDHLEPELLQGRGFDSRRFSLQTSLRDWIVLRSAPQEFQWIVWLDSTENSGGSRLYRWEDAEQALRLWIELPEGIHRIRAHDVDGDGADDLILEDEASLLVSLFRPGAGELKPPERLLGSAGLHLDDWVPSSDPSELAFAKPARIDRFRIREGQLQTEDNLNLPVRVERHATRVDLTSPSVTHLGPIQGREVYITEAWSEDDLRFTSQVLSPGSESLGAWGRFARPSKIVHQWPLKWRDRAILAVATRDSLKLGLLEKVELEVFPLRSDRSREGYISFFQTESRSRSWQKMEVILEDLHSDPNPDLVVLQTEGLGGEKLQIDLFAGNASGFSHRATRLELKDARDWTLIDDVNGDGLSDLLLKGEVHWRIQLSERSKRGPFSKKGILRLSPIAADTEIVAAVTVGGEGTTVEVGDDSHWNRTEAFDWDGDGQREVVVGYWVEGLGAVLEVFDLSPGS